MKKMFSLVLALVMALSLTTVAWGAELTVGTGGTYATMQDAVDHAASGDTVVLKSNVNGNGVVIDKNITIDLGGFTYTIDGYTVGSKHTETLGIQIYDGITVTIKNGTIVGSDLADKPGCPDGASCTASTASGHDVNPKVDYGVKMVIQNYANLTLDSVTVTGNSKAGYVVSNNSGNVVLEDTAITATAGNVAFDTCKYASYAVPTVTVKGTSVITGDVEASGGKLDVQGGTVNGDINVEGNGAATDITISGGTFTDDVSDYVAPTAGFTTNPDGSVTVGAKATTGAYDLYSCNNTAVASATGLSYTKVAAAPKTDGTGTIAYVAVDNGKNYVQIGATEATKADFYLTAAGSKTAVMYLRETPTVSYIASAKAFTNFGYSCGQIVKQYGDTNEYYQVLDGAYKNRVFKAGVGGSAFLVDGKIVTLTEEVFPTAHVWSTTAVDSTTGVPTAAICAKCSTRGTVYASVAKVPASATIDPVKLTFNGVEYPVVAGYKTVAGPVTTTPTVESAKTFDAGIAMYVGMSVMAAAGSAVVIGKKKD